MQETNVKKYDKGFVNHCLANMVDKFTNAVYPAQQPEPETTTKPESKLLV